MPLAQGLDDFQRIWLRPSADHPGFQIEQQAQMRQRMLDFLASDGDVFQRSHPPGHFTGSALVVDGALNRVALCLHKKLGKWLQFGGHADGHNRLDEVGLREAQEESGIVHLEFLAYESLFGDPARRVPLDLDIHEIPSWKEVPAHYHYDVIYLLQTHSPEQLQSSDESEAVAWYSLDKARELCQEQNLQRCFSKIEWIRNRLPSD